MAPVHSASVLVRGVVLVLGPQGNEIPFPGSTHSKLDGGCGHGKNMRRRLPTAEEGSAGFEHSSSWIRLWCFGTRDIARWKSALRGRVSVELSWRSRVVEISGTDQQLRFGQESDCLR